MGWFQTGLVAFTLMTGPRAQAMPDKSVVSSPAPGAVTANCDDFEHIADEVFTGRTGATFAVGGTSEYLGGDTFGRDVLKIGGVDPAIYLQQHCDR